MTAVDDEDDEYEIPLRDQRYFGAGLKRKRVRFVPATESTQPIGSASLPTTPSASSAADRYLAIVLGQSNTAERASSAPVGEQVAAKPSQAKESDTSNEDASLEKPKPLDDAGALYCDLCRRSIAANVSRAAHESSIVHQISLQHSFPPSYVDRERKGLAVLQDHGWDPDSRLGLGAKGEGILQPIKAVDNPHKAGVGARLAPAKIKEKPVKLDAGKVRRLEQEGKKKAERLRNSFYMSDDVQKRWRLAAAKKYIRLNFLKEHENTGRSDILAYTYKILLISHITSTSDPIWEHSLLLPSNTPDF